MVKFGYTIVYVKDVKAELDFFVNTFGFKVKFITPDGDYGELETGQTVLSFASYSLANDNFGDKYTELSMKKGFSVELALIADNVGLTHNKALEKGAKELKKVSIKPWGQEVSYILTPQDVLVEICSPIDD
ncbi:MAG TPA: glyoxalase [Alphaproteobacteria bacterium]|nr:glyoxalase [Alphaproteobacteria bacterium]